MASRKYEQRERAEKQAETRRRIVEATMQLHEEVGPAKTTVAEVARRAGVTRVTVYNNFPDDYELVAACQSHYLALKPPPDPTAALALEDPAERLSAVLRSFYERYRDTERMSANVRRDRAAVPALDRLLSATMDRQMDELTGVLAAGFAPRGRPGKQLRAAVALSLDFWTWKRLANEGLSGRAAADLMVGLVLGVAPAG
jgi:AcrR family transcriptional regulator